MDNLSNLNKPIQNIQNQGGNQQNNFVMPSIIDTLSGWMKFIGIYTIVIGAITCIGIITAALGVPMIFAGIALTKGSSSIKLYKEYSSPFILNELFTSLNKYFKIQGILAIVGIVISIIYFVFILFFSAMAINGFFQGF